jgi:lactate dehydrogenase-like 2-hydroxyacid dehydrogenase
MNPESLPVVVVTEAEYRRGERVYASATAAQCVPAPAAEGLLVEAVKRTGARHAIVGGVKYERALYESLPRGSVVARMGVGYDGINLPRATESGVVCTNTPGALDQSVAELTMLFICAAARHFPRTANETRQGAWTLHEGQEIAGKTLAIIGSGRIGTAIARIAAAGFGMRVIGCRRTRPDVIDAAFERITSDFGDAVREADFVSLNVPASSENVNFLNRDRLAAIPAHAWLINTARGAVLDEIALFDALVQERIAGAALDVYQREPYEPLDSARDLRTLPNVILAPHIGSHTVEANRRMAERALANVVFGEARNYLAMDVLNRDVLQQLSRT